MASARAGAIEVRAADARRPRRPRMRRSLWLAPPVLALAAVALYPLGYVVYTALTGASPTYGGEGFGRAFGRVITSPELTRALLGSVRIASISTAGAIVLGFVLALIVSFVPFRGSGLVSRFVDLGVAFPSFFIALSFVFLYGSAGFFNGALESALGTASPPLTFLRSQWGVILAEITFYTPFVMRPLLAAFTQIDSALIEVASSLGARPGRVVRQVIFPEAVPALLAGGSLCLVLTLNEFGIVLFMGAKGVSTLPVFIYSQKATFDFVAASAGAVVSIALSLTLYASYRLLLSRSGGARAAVV